MTIARHYRMTAKDGAGEPLRTALVDLVAALQGIPGFAGAEMMRDVEAPELFVFIELWESVESHKAALGLLPKTALAPLMDAVAGRPEGAYLQVLPTA